MAKHNELGTTGETCARDFLVSKGYIIRHTNYRIGKLELDIVAEKDGWLVIVEVRTRSTEFFIAPEESIDLRKIKNLVNAASGYIRFHNWQGETRFDVISVIPLGDDYKIEHIEDAFLPPVN
jgi:putative endonuclease